MSEPKRAMWQQLDDQGRALPGQSRVPDRGTAHLRQVRDSVGRIQVDCPRGHIVAVVTSETPAQLVTWNGETSLAESESLPDLEPLLCNCLLSETVSRASIRALLQSLGPPDGRRAVRIGWDQVAGR